MSNSFKFRRDPFQPQPLTPGPLGYNDSASPDSPEEYLGETPGPLGMNDYADPNVHHRATMSRKGSIKANRKWNPQAAAAYLKNPSNGWAGRRSTSRCAKAVREAINAGNIATPNNPISAADYKNYLPKMGFVSLSIKTYVPQVGDIAVFPAAPQSGHVHGHIAMYTGEHWQSDYIQDKKCTDGKFGKGFFANSIWVNTPFTIFRR